MATQLLPIGHLPFPAYMDFIINNGKLSPRSQSVAGADHPALTYGIGMFETILFSQGRPAAWTYHMDRLIQGLAALNISIDAPVFTPLLLSDAEKLLTSNNLSNAVVRIQAGLPESVNSERPLDYFMTTKSVPDSSENGIDLVVYEGARKSADAFSSFKHCNYMPYTLALKHAVACQADDALVKNSMGRICDSARANLFIIASGTIHTPPISEGCIAGVFRRYLLDELGKEGMPVKENALDENSILRADEVFLTNSVRGIMPVKKIGEKKYNIAQGTALRKKYPVEGLLDL